MTGPAPWLPQLPASWKTVQIRRVATLRNGADYKEVEVEDGGYPVYGSGGEFRRASQYLYDGPSVLFGRKGTINRPLLVNGRFWTVDTMFYTELGGSIEPRFLHYYATTMPFSYYTTNTALPSMAQNELAGHHMPLPPMEEQRAIADYLDRETVRIDTLIEEQQHLIDLLREKRQCIVDHAMSSVESNVKPLRRAIVFLTSGSRGWSTYYAETGKRFLRVGNLPRTNLTLGGEIQFVELPNDVLEGARTRLRAGDLLFSITAYLGSVAVVNDDEWVDGYVSQHVALCRLKQDRYEPRFVGWMMLSTGGQDQLKRGGAGGTKMQLSLDDIRDLRVPDLVLDEQRRIAAYLDEQTSRIDRLIVESQRFIELSRERRAALVTAAVTGQIDVREAA